MESLNWLPIVIGAILAFLVGWAWYSPKMFGTKWAEGSKVELGSASSMPAGAMIAQLLALLSLSVVVGLTALSNDLWTAIAAIMAAALFMLSSSKFSGKTQYATMVDFGYIIVAGVIMIVVQGIL